MGIEEYIISGLIALGAAAIGYFIGALVVDYLTSDSLKKALAKIKEELLEKKHISSINDVLNTKLVLTDSNTVSANFYKCGVNKQIKFESIDSDLRKELLKGMEMTC